ncbi:MAG: DUF2281 domain-containing protein [Leptospiraceae bacterium]|nr:DUF2281 domain-containing protein [Leptospiraceae bacterium]MCP5495843.1 DUF2281 domain-containing protein [Leptospiraceae bacterium]
MTIVEKLNEISKQLPERFLLELLDFAEFLKQKVYVDAKPINLGAKIHLRFKDLYMDELFIPPRQQVRNPPNFS